MRTLPKISAMTAVFGAAMMAGAQTSSDALVKQDFKDGVSGWTAFGTAAKVSVTHAAPAAATGASALQFDYKIDKGEMDALVLPSEPGTLAKAKSIKFRIMTDSDAAVAVVLQEKDGGRYVAMCLGAKNAWQTCELSISDFHLTQEANDPVDPDGKLDLDRVNGVGIIDMGELVGAGDNDPIAELMHVTKGSHTFYLDQFSIGTETVPTISSTGDAGSVMIDNFVHPQLNWVEIGALKLSQGKSSAAMGASLNWSYKQEANKFVAASTSFTMGLLKGTTALSFDLTSTRGGSMRVQVEETGGIKFNTSVDLPAGGTPKHILLNFSDFRSSEDSSDPNAKLDLSKVKTLMFADVSGIMAQADPDHADNTLSIAHLRAVQAK